MTQSLAEQAAVLETHIGLVLLYGDRAYKLKKPVRTAFCDFSTPQRRRDALARELELNRRLAPDVYLGVSEIGPLHEPGMPAPAEAGEPLLVMRRMPAARRLSTMVRDGAPVGPALRRLARRVAVFHAGARRSAAISADGDAPALMRRWSDNLAELEPFRDRLLDTGTLDELARLVMRFLAARGPLFARRVADGHVVDGHGDLLADDIYCLDDGPRVLDCLEFDDRLRHVDVLDDVAFLAMDLERLGRADLATLLLDAYAGFSADPAPSSLVHHYVAYRAVVRLKVACLRHDQGDPHAAEQARLLALVALRHLREGAVRLVLVGGLPGTGKSTIAGGLADRFGATLLSTDALRAQVPGDPTAADGPAPATGFRRGRYTPERVHRTYEALRERAGLLLARGESVVLDASWTDAAERDAAARLAEEHVADLVALRCTAAPAVAAARIVDRVAGSTPSEATPEIAAAMAAAEDPWPEAIPVDTELPVERSLEQAGSAWHRAGRAAVAVARAAG
ncbi:AAA family ATPase [Pseudonocardia sp.]|uniref:bifunctional aminoglycoside phosphotransferase/ATP-binding protein n=1 Tax=Pseudonocardia sp. TaxID=60912 RepID=UPI003D13FF3B